jgi:hypothetical protein
MAEQTTSAGPVLPNQIPTAAAFAALRHILNHGHDGVDPEDHFGGVLVDLLGLGQADPARAAAEAAVIVAMTAHPRDQAAVEEALTALSELREGKAGADHAERGG